ncbi:hypothetical protein ONO57_25935, partial [Salmonella enterica subsp. enterica serovar Anatum]|nr:hypothetical protein [Salmonella enterica subsp. enterica serovar Anatum]
MPFVVLVGGSSLDFEVPQLVTDALLAVCALIIGLALAMFFAVWESVKWRPIAWIGSALVTILRGLP